MSRGRNKDAEKAKRAAELATSSADAQRIQTEANVAKEKNKSQQLFIRQLRSSQGGGFFQQSNSLG